MRFDYEDLNNLHRKLNQINDNLEKANQPQNDSGGSGLPGWKIGLYVFLFIIAIQALTGIGLLIDSGGNKLVELLGDKSDLVGGILVALVLMGFVVAGIIQILKWRK